MSLLDTEAIRIERAIEEWQSEEENIGKELTMDIFSEFVLCGESLSYETLGKVIKYIKFLEYAVDACKKAEKEASNNRKAFETRIDSLESYILPFVVKNEIKIFDQYKIRITNTQSTEIFDETLIPEDFVTIVEERKYDKKAIKEFLQKEIVDGETGETKLQEMPGARISYNKNITIK